MHEKILVFIKIILISSSNQNSLITNRDRMELTIRHAAYW